jgi:hypothetical protein
MLDGIMSSSSGMSMSKGDSGVELSSTTSAGISPLLSILSTFFSYTLSLLSWHLFDVSNDANGSFGNSSFISISLSLVISSFIVLLDCDTGSK